MALRRCLVYCPANNQRMINKASSLKKDEAPDILCLDLEDSVSLEHVAEARARAKDAILRMQFANELALRLHCVRDDLFSGDLELLAELVDCPSSNKLRGPLPASIVLPKVESSEEIKYLGEKLSTLQVRAKLTRPLPIFAIIETAKGLVNVHKIASAGMHVEALLFGAEDLAADVGLERSSSAQELLYGRSRVVMAAAANRLQSLDMVCVDYLDTVKLQQECLEGYRMGFTGKQAIHPGQVMKIHEAFLPSPARIQWAEAVLKAAKSEGKGAFVVSQKMVDMPVIKAAQKILQATQSLSNSQESTTN